jgi:hypothetical protein
MATATMTMTTRMARRQRRWRWRDGLQDTTTMAADDDDNEVDGKTLSPVLASVDTWTIHKNNII